MINDTTARKGRAALADIAGRNAGCPAGCALDLVHHLPGRLRLRSTALKRDARAIEHRRRQLAEISGVTSVEANPSTGSLLLEYDPTVMPPANVVEVLAPCGITARPVTEGSEPGRSEELITALKRSMLEVLAQRLMLAIIGAAA
jgi:copper chaperone CopZ